MPVALQLASAALLPLKTACASPRRSAMLYGAPVTSLVPLLLHNLLLHSSEPT